MYLHLGGSYVVNEKDILGIFDIETTTVSAVTKKYLSVAQKSHKIINVTDDLPRSFVVCSDKGNTVVYLTQYNSQTLMKKEVRF